MNHAATIRPITSTLLAHVPHAFSTRPGGVSGKDASHAHFASLNFGNPGELKGADRDPVSNIEANWSRLLGAIGASDRRVVEVHQVHGPTVVVVRAGEEPWPGASPKADALVTDDQRVMIAVRIADCAPVLLASDDGRVVGAVHAGWRGVIAGVLPNAVRAMMDLVPGVHGAHVRAAIGPCIEAASFEVGEEVVAEFTRAFPDRWPEIVHAPGTITTPRGTPNAKHHVDIKMALRIQCEMLGIRRVDVIPGCTLCDAERFFSHRRDALKSGRLAAVIGPHAARPHAARP
jgi:YfiH family protein